MCFELPRVAENIDVTAMVEVRHWDAQVGMNIFLMVEAPEELIQPHGTDTWAAKTRLRHTDLLAARQESRPTNG
jgi:hypothetical protein